MTKDWNVHNPKGSQRILVTKKLPGEEWLESLIRNDYRVEVCPYDNLVTKNSIKNRFNNECSGVIGQLTEDWDKSLFNAFSQVGGQIYCNYAVGYDNVDVKAANNFQIAIGNIPGVLTETTAELAVALTLACARRIVEADTFVQKGNFDGWLPNLFLGEKLQGKTLGIIGAGRIGSTYSKIMVSAFNMNLIYHSRHKNKDLEKDLESPGKQKINKSIRVKFLEDKEELFKQADIISLHTPLSGETHHMVDSNSLSQMKDDTILINTSRGPVIDEEALAKHCKANENFRVGLDVFEQEPKVNEELLSLNNVILTPHIGSATKWTREGMAKLAALNIIGVIEKYPLWDKDDMLPFFKKAPPKAIPSVVNALSLNLS